MNSLLMRTIKSTLVLLVFGVVSWTVAQTPSITSIGGYSDGAGVSNGRWTGQPSYAPATASNQFKNYLAIDTWDSASANYWLINGSGFGNSQGNGGVSLSMDGYGPYQFYISKIESWTNTQIKVRVSAIWSFTAQRNAKVVVRTSSGAATSRSENLVATPRGRGYGQCTFEVFYKRRNAGLQPPSSAYPSPTKISAAYVPKQWDVLFWGTMHTAIIISAPQRSQASNGQITYTFTVAESNARWDEKSTTRTSTFSIKGSSVTQGIVSNMSSTNAATGFWR